MSFFNRGAVLLCGSKRNGPELRELLILSMHVTACAPLCPKTSMLAIEITGPVSRLNVLAFGSGERRQLRAFSPILNPHCTPYNNPYRPL